VPEERQQVDLQDPGEVLRAVPGHGPGQGGEAVQFQGAGVVATARPHDRKVQRLAGGLDAPAEVTVGQDWRQEAAAEFRENRDAAAAARESRGHAEEAERIALRATDGEVGAAPEELRSAEALTVAGQVPGQEAGTVQVRE